MRGTVGAFAVLVVLGCSESEPPTQIQSTGGSAGVGGSGAVGASGAVGGGSGSGGVAGSSGGIGGSGASAAGGVGAFGGYGGSITWDGPQTLSETGLFSDIATRTLASDVRQYGVRNQLWTDAASKTRYFKLPTGTQIDTTVMDAWKFPVGATAWKDFESGGKLLETRMVAKLSDNPPEWSYVAYRWRDDGSDADAVPYGEADTQGTTHDIPNIPACKECHGGTREYFLGFSAVQLPQSDIDQLAAAGSLTSPPMAPFVIPGDAKAQAALGYLHGNCAHCHSAAHPLAMYNNFRAGLSVTNTDVAATALYQTGLNVSTSHDIDGTVMIIVPGQPDQSQLYNRVNRRDLLAMPPLGTEQVDVSSVALLKAWIEGL